MSNGTLTLQLVDANGNVLGTTGNPLNQTLSQVLAGAFADGAIVTIGTEADTAETDPTQSATLIALAKGILEQQQAKFSKGVVFQAAVGASGNGNAIIVTGYSTLTIEVFGASTPAGTVSFEAASTSGTYAPITGTNLNGFTQATSTTAISATPVQWQFSVEGLDTFQCPVAWTSGTITVQGRLSV